MKSSTPERLVQRERTCLQPLGERLAFDQFEHQELCAVRLFQSVDRGNVWMIERGKDLRFTAEARDAIGIVDEALG